MSIPAPNTTTCLGRRDLEEVVEDGLDDDGGGGGGGGGGAGDKVGLYM